MISWLGKSWWQGLGVLLTVLLAIGGLWWQQSRKELSYEVVSQTSLVSLEDPTAQQLQVLFNGKPVADVSLIVLRMQNTGNIPIPTADYEKPLTFRFGQGVEVLNAEITSMTPPNIGASIISNPNGIELAPILLNNGDEVLLKVLVTGTNINVDADARIIGVAEIIEREVDKTSITDNIVLFMNSTTSTSIGFFLFSSLKGLERRIWPVTIAYFIALLSFLLGITGYLLLISRLLPYFI